MLRAARPQNLAGSEILERLQSTGQRLERKLLSGYDAQHDLAALVGRTGKHLVRDTGFFQPQHCPDIPTLTIIPFILNGYVCRQISGND